MLQSNVNVTTVADRKGQLGQTDRQDRSSQRKRGFPKIFRNQKRKNQLTQEEKDLILNRVCRIKSQRNFMLFLEPDSAFTERYTEGKQLGQGSNATVRQAVSCQNGQEYAVKIYDRANLVDENRKLNLFREVKILKKVNHPQIIRLVQVMNCEKAVYIVTELFCKRHLLTYLKSRKNKLPEAEAAQIFLKLVRAVDYLHQQKIVHRDIKLQNVLINKNREIKLIDFGYATEIDASQKLKNFCGTPSYMAPEMVLKKGYSGKPIDIWSLGVVLYRLVVGVMPFKATDEKALYAKILGGEYREPIEVGPLFCDLVRGLLNIDPEERLKSSDVLQSTWLKSVLP